MKRDLITPRIAIVALVLLAASAGLWSVLLFRLAAPDHMKVRVVALESSLDRINRVARARGDAGSFAAGAVCAAAGPGANALVTRIEQAAAGAGVALKTLSVRPGEDTGTAELTPIAVQVEALGRQDAMMSMLSTLSQGGTTIFVETADLKPQAAGMIDLKLNGRALCWNAARS